MSEHDPDSLPASSAPPPLIDHAPAAPAPVLRRRGGTPLLLTLLLAAGLGGAIYWTWTNPHEVAVAVAPADPQPAIDAAKAQLAGQIQTMDQQVAALTARVDALEKQPAAPVAAAPSPEAVADLAKRLDDMGTHVDALSAKQDAQAAEIQKNAEVAAQKPAGAAPAPAPDATAAQVPALVAQQEAADHRLSEGLAAQKTASEQALADQKAAAGHALSQQKAALDALDQRLAKLEQGSGQIQAQDQAEQQTQAQAKDRLAALDSRVGKLEQQSGQVEGAAKDASRAMRLEAAGAALQAGQPLGELSGAPPALAKFASAAPPTESGLRAEFPRVAEAARAASQPDVSHRSFLDRALARVQQSVTIRRGDHVLVGDPAAGVLARAQTLVNAGDLKGAADTLGTLNGPAAAAAKDWVAQVRALLDARAALAAMAHG